MDDVERIDEAFLPNIVMSDGFTVMERVGEHVAIEYQTGRPQTMLLGYSGKAQSDG